MLTSDRKHGLPALGGSSVDARGIVPTSTCTQARVRLYQASQKPGARDGAWQVSSWGKCRVSGRLGQRHADCLEAIFYNAERVQRTDDGALYLLVDPARVRRCISAAGYSSEGLAKLLREIMSAVIEIEASADMRIMGHLIDEVIESPVRRRNPLGGDRAMMRVRVGAVAAGLIEHDLHMRHDPAPIAALRSGVSQAIARHVLSHKAAPSGGWRLDGLLDAVGVDPAGNARRNARRAVRGDLDGLALVGIVIDGDRIRRGEAEIAR
ncbi:MAG: ABC transporter ATPase [Metallibacterium scheffleri]|jgi:hypothetical protein|uniref:ABC transporter ATPase n=1 Tax=Metallibacterium scheffleri TaxID=993689 RepID=UPI0026F05DBC|nr:ABC transporter ATPase [Metallibacterium scheffleri]MCK9367396.1 ABC transporter ATPase [Metallibacterium scheffleri]